MSATPYIISKLRQELDYLHYLESYKSKSWFYRLFNKPPELWQIKEDFLPSDNGKNLEQQVVELKKRIKEFRGSVL